MSALPALRELNHWLASQIVGQPGLIERLLVALIADGHLLVEGAPGASQDQSHQNPI